MEHLSPSQVVTGLGRNRVIRYGSKLPYNSPIQSKNLPQWLEFLVSRLLAKKLLSERPDHVTINEYAKGQSIDWHIDSKTSGPVITVLSLLSPATMGLQDVNGQELHYPLPERSLLQMSDKERWEDKHCIFPVENLRFSIVFRKGTK